MVHHPLKFCSSRHIVPEKYHSKLWLSKCLLFQTYHLWKVLHQNTIWMKSLYFFIFLCDKHKYNSPSFEILLFQICHLWEILQQTMTICMPALSDTSSLRYITSKQNIDKEFAVFSFFSNNKHKYGSPSFKILFFRTNQTW